MRLETTRYESPVGPLRILEGPEGPLAIEFPGRGERLVWTPRLRGPSPAIEVVEGDCRWTRDWLDGYFAGTPKPFPYPRYLARWMPLSEDQIAVLRLLRRIPFGETRSYAQVARASGLHPRLVGQMVGSNPLTILIPCHRVVGKDGSLVGYGGGLNRKRWLLAHEERHAGIVLR